MHCRYTEHTDDFDVTLTTSPTAVAQQLNSMSVLPRWWEVQSPFTCVVASELRPPAIRAHRRRRHDAHGLPLCCSAAVKYCKCEASTVASITAVFGVVTSVCLPSAPPILELHHKLIASLTTKARKTISTEILALCQRVDAAI